MWPSAVAGISNAGEFCEGRTEVDVFDYLVAGSSMDDPRAGDNQRHVDVGIEGGHLSRLQAVLAHLIAVVGAEDEIGVLCLTACCRRSPQVTDHPVDG